MLYFGYLITFVSWSIWLYFLLKVKSQKNGFNNFLILSSFLVGFYSISFGIFGIQISFYKILPAFIVFIYLIGSKFRMPKSILYIFIYFILVSIISYIIAIATGQFEEIISLGRNPKAAYLYPLVQSILFLSSIFQIWCISRNSKIEHLKILAYFSYGTLVLVLIGYLQIICLRYGLPWFKYWFLSDATGRTVNDLVSLAGDRGIFRMSSLGGEPRHFASILSLSIVNILYLRSIKINLNLISGKYGLVSILILFSGIFASLSASGLLALIIGIAVYIFLTDKFKFFIFILVVTSFSLFLQNQLFFITEIFWKLGNIEIMLYAAPKDSFALKAIFDNLINFIFGYGIGMVDLFKKEFYLIQDSPFGLKNRYLLVNPMQSLIMPTSPILQVIVNGGLIGFLLLFNKINKIFKSMDKKTIIYTLTISSMGVSSSILLFSIGLFLISIAFNYQYQNSIIND